MSENLVIVESPAKAKTISRFLGKDYVIKASMGHIRDLPKSKMGIDTAKNFEPTYEISEDKKKVISDLKKELKNHPKVWIATDEDREGEAIGWHLCHALKLDPEKVERIVFHEITKSAILHSLETPRKIDLNLVDAQQARRVLDRLVGYELSPLLWKKVRRGLSAGRVQSVAVRLIVEREREIREFDPQEYWKFTADFSQPDFIAELNKLDGKVIRPKDKPALINSAEKAEKLEKGLEGAEYKIASIDEKDGVMNPAPPFTTSTLQQEASRKLGYGVKQTMTIAQRLYEGNEVKIKGHTGGLITYMRTDSVNLSAEAQSQAREVITNLYGKEYSLENGRGYKTKSKGAQEAHEAIRPTNMSLVPDEIKSQFDDVKFWKLYKLIWERAVACQMAQAKVKRTTVKVEAESKGVGLCEFVAKGQVIEFDGFLRVYSEGKDEGDDNNDEENNSCLDKLLPKMPEGEVCDLKELTKEQCFTLPPPRYTEASLVKKLESEGIGRPSTYAPTISTIQTRGYIEKNEDKKLVPTDIAEVVTDFLVQHFGKVVDYKFTANIEEEFDVVAEGKKKWTEIMQDFYGEFHETVKEKDETVDRNEVLQAREIGIDPESGKPVSVRIGPFGPFAQIGTKDDAEKPKFASLLKGQSMQDITLEEALKLFDLPRTLGQDKDGNDVIVNRGRFGPYVKIKSNFYSIREDDPLEISLERALEIVQSEIERKEKMKIKIWEDEDISILDGRFGPYIKHDKKNYKLTKEQKEKAKDMTLEEVKEIIATTKPSGGGWKGRKKKA